jgi:hypothetical protein
VFVDANDGQLAPRRGAGPEHRQRPPIALPEHGERSVSGLSAREDGFSVHATTTAPAGDARSRETLRKYVLRVRASALLEKVVG